jgi:prophage antirepressor-like protein
MGWRQTFLGRWLDPEEVPPDPPESTVRDNELEVLQFHGGDIRTIWIKGWQWWVAADVCGAVEIANPGTAMASLDPDEKGIHLMETPGGPQQMAIVNEPGLYHLLSKSNKPKAKEFWRWVRHDVLPAIRQTGSYSTDQTPIRKWIKKRAGRHGFPPSWMKKRQKVADGNNVARTLVFSIGGDAIASSNRHNWLCEGAFSKDTRQLKDEVGCRDKDSPLDHMDEVTLSMCDFANSINVRQMQEGLVAIGDLDKKVKATGRACREMALEQFEPGFDFGPTEDAKGHKILGLMRQLPGAAS